MNGVNIQWGLAGNGGSGMEKAVAGYRAGKEERRQIELERALSALGPGLDNQQAMARVFQLDPGLGAGVEDAAWRRGERQRATETQQALADYYSISGAPQTAQPGPASVGAMLGVTSHDGSETEMLPAAMPSPAPVLSPQDAAYERLMQASPEAAFKVREQEADRQEMTSFQRDAAGAGALPGTPEYQRLLEARYNQPRYYGSPVGGYEVDPSYQPIFGGGAAPPPSASGGGQTATNPQTGEVIRLNPQTGQWEPVNGGASPSGSPTFP